MSTFACTRCAERHPLQELGFNLPDAAFAHGHSPEARAQLPNNEDTLVLGRAHFIRGWAELRIHGREPWGLGFWVKVSPDDFADFERRGRVGHPPYAVTIANQDLLEAPTFGLLAELTARGPGQRPAIRFTGETHPLTHLQRDGVPEATFTRWLSSAFHHGEPQPSDAPFDGTLEQHGWRIVSAMETGGWPASLAKTPSPGDTVKVRVQVASVGLEGEPFELSAGWWVRLDDVSREGLWSGTLASHVRVPATLSLGARVWVRPEQVLEHAAGS